MGEWDAVEAVGLDTPAPIRHAAEDDRRLRAAEPFAWPDLEAAVLFAIEHYEVQDLAPEPRQHLGVAATEHELTDTTCH
jgi:hypothetical protein